MSRVMKLTQVAILFSTLTLGACRDQQASAQTSAQTRAQIREQMGDAPARIDTTTAYRLSAAFRGAAEQALPAVVRVSVTTQPRVASNSQRGQRQIIPRGFPFPLPYGDDDAQPRGGRGTGSGFVFDARGYIMTNNHVVEDADRVLVSMVDGREYTATVVGGDPQTDVAVIKIDARNGEKLQPVSFGSSDDLHVGDWVIALGNPLNLQFTVTAGIVSAKGRNLGILDNNNNQGGGSAGLESFIQTDAVINPGNSGGPMVDLTGKVVGINSAIESATGVWAGNGFAIPIDLARKVANDIIEFGRVRRPRLGVTVGTINAADAEVYKLPSVSGAEITSVQPGQSGDRAGLQMGDVVVSLNDMPIRTQSEFMEELARQRPGERVKLGVVRYGQRLEKAATLGEFEARPARATVQPARPRSHETLGFGVTAITPQIAQELGSNIRSGLVIDEVDPLSGAVEGGVARGMVLRKINGKDVTTPEDVDRIAASLKPGQTVSLIVRLPGGGQEYDTIVNYRVR
jgi:serine protease Do